MARVTIGSLRTGKIISFRTNGQNPVFRRSNGQLWLKLNEDFHIRVNRDRAKNSWISYGLPEQINPEEMVEIVYAPNIP